MGNEDGASSEVESHSESSTESPPVAKPDPIISTNQNPPAHTQPVNLDELVNAINALPERIQNSIAESLKPPKAPAKEAKPETEKPKVEQETQRRKSFAERWFE